MVFVTIYVADAFKDPPVDPDAYPNGVLGGMAGAGPLEDDLT